MGRLCRYEVPPLTAMPFLWDDPMNTDRHIMLTAGQAIRKVDLTALGELKPIVVPRGTRTASRWAGYVNT